MTVAADTPIAERWFLGVRLSLLDLPAAAAVIAARPVDAPFAFVVTPNAQHVVLINRGDQALASAYQAAWLRLCDSQILRLIGRLMFGLSLPHCAGSDLTAYMFQHVIKPDDPITVIGGDDELADRLRKRFGLTRLAMHVPPMGFIKNPAAVEACLQFVAAHPARFVFLAVGAPRSEIAASRLATMAGVTGVGLCIGSSLHFITDLVPRAPVWMRRLALEWLFRLLRDPRQHAARVFDDSLPIFAIAWRARRNGQHQPRGAADPA